MTYEATAHALVRRIEALVPTHPEILTLTSPWDLFTVPGFTCEDLQPTLMQADAALVAVRARHALRK